ncbi:MAG: AAA family ATPase [Calothrix sp. SM1_7_51]|nr:AAA family ATPase [Calothrix sp. SM1_7_51]
MGWSCKSKPFKLLIKKFIALFATKEHPLVLFLDDLQWADATSLNLIQSLMLESKVSKANSSLSSIWSDDKEQERNPFSLLLVGAYRSNEVTNVHPLTLAIQDIHNTQGVIQILKVDELSQSELNRLIADTLNRRAKNVNPLTKAIYSKTKGNPFFSQQYLKSLHKEGLITFNYSRKYCECDIEKIQALSLTDDVVEFLAGEIGKLLEPVQKTLQVAACMGNEFELKSLSRICEKSASQTIHDLWKPLAEGMIVPLGDVRYGFEADERSKLLDYQAKDLNVKYQAPRYRFAHDRVQEATYGLIPLEERKPLHLKIGRNLLENTPIEERIEKIFDIVEQFNKALELITDEIEINELIEANLIAGIKATRATAYTLALEYLTTGIQLLRADCWQSQYNMALSLYEKQQKQHT